MESRLLGSHSKSVAGTENQAGQQDSPHTGYTWPGTLQTLSAGPGWRTEILFNCLLNRLLFHSLIVLNPTHITGCPHYLGLGAVLQYSKFGYFLTYCQFKVYFSCVLAICFQASEIFVVPALFFLIQHYDYNLF